jgi:hypothetical protein
MPEIPRIKKRISSAERLQPIEPIRRTVKADTTEAQVLAEVGKGLIGTAEIVGTLQDFEADKLTTQASRVSDLIRDDMVQFAANAKTLLGNDAVGIDEYNAEFQRSKSARLAELGLEGTRVGDVVTANMESLNNRFKEKLVFHQEAEQVNAALDSTDAILENAKTQANLFPEDADTIIAEAASNIDTVAPIIGAEKARELKRQVEIETKQNMIMAVALDDMEQAEELLSTHRATLPKESTTLVEKEMSRIKKQTELDIKKAEQQAAEDWRGDFNQRLADGNPMGVGEIAAAPIPEKEKTTLINRSANTPGRFEITDPVIYADLSSTVDLRPDSLTQSDIWAKAGDGISTADAERLSKRLKTAQEKGSKENDKDPEIKNATSILDFARKDGKYADNPQENDLEWARQKAALDDFIENNPDEDPIKYVEKNLIPAQKGFVKSVVDFFSFGPEGAELPVVEDLPERRRAIEALTEAGAPLTEANISEASRQLQEQAEPTQGRKAPTLQGL